MPNFIIPAELAQAIANYLGTRPYVEVAGFINALQQLRPVQKEDRDASDQRD